VRGVTLQNTVGLCVACHAAVTGDVGGHRAHIRYDPDRGLFEWWARMGTDVDGIGNWVYVGYLKKKSLVDGEPEAKRIRRTEGLCSECGRPLPHDHERKPMPKRKTTSYNMFVPDDEEVGTDVLDDWVDQFAVMLGFGEASTRLKRYHVIALIMAWAAMNKTQFLRDLEEAEFWARGN
jgi:hypothetical protein